MEWLIMFQLLCFLFFLNFSHITCSSNFSSLASSLPPLCLSDQSFALLQFKNGFIFNRSASSEICDDFGVPSYPKMKSWKKGSDCCTWDGVTCDGVTGHVIGLDLSCSWLQGTIQYSNNSLFLLPHLQRINLAGNDFRCSQISSRFGRFVSLTHLNLSNSQFCGRVPSEMSHLSKLISLDLSSNYFIFNPQLTLEPHSFKLLLQNLTQLQELLLDAVDMSSIVPSSLMNLSSSLTSLSLTNCQLQGKFPGNLFRLPNLQNLYLKRNFELTGYFPTSNWSSPLEFLDLYFTSFSGEIPHSISNLKSLKYLYIEGCNFIGSIPASLGNLTQLIALELSYSNFSGEIPDVFGNIKNLEFLSLFGNNFEGQLPSSMLNLTKLVFIDMSANGLVGPIPDHISHFSKLERLVLFFNLLNGAIPSWLFTHASLLHLDLRYNQLSGVINAFQYKSLEYIDLSNNNLHGPIPSSLFELVNPTYICLSSNNFSGIVDLDMFSKFKNLNYLDLSFNSLSLSTGSNINSNWSQLHSLGLSSCNMSEFPDFLRTQKELDSLDLSNNRIHGQIPKWMLDVGKNSLRYLNLSHNILLTGIEQLPLRKLEYLDIRFNLLQGSLPNPPPSVELFLISNNRLTGTIPLSICNMSLIRVLDLSNNSLSGVIPQCLGNFSDDLSVLDLRMNSFHGTIPQTFLKCKSLRNLGLNGNMFEGSLPHSLINCTMLEVLDLGNNKINGTFPYWLETLPKLQVLVLRSNQFHGLIGNPKSKSPFPKLRILDLSHNEFTGHLPSTYFQKLKSMMNADEDKVELKYMGDGGGSYYHDSVMVTMKGNEIELVKILTIFTTIDISNNNFRGEIPKVIGTLELLKGLNLSHNRLTEYIPSSLGNLINLEWLDLSSNRLTGKIPERLADLTSLAVLNLSKNQLVGPIPIGNQFNTFTNGSYEGNLGLCGFPLSKTCSKDEPPPSTFQQEDDSVSTNGFSWKITLMGYGCGLVFGLSMGYIVFSTGRPEWLVRMVEGKRYRKKKRLQANARRRRGRRN